MEGRHVGWETKRRIWRGFQIFVKPFRKNLCAQVIFLNRGCRWFLGSTDSLHFSFSAFQPAKRNGREDRRPTIPSLPPSPDASPARSYRVPGHHSTFRFALAL